MRHHETAENVEIQLNLPIARRIFYDEEYTMEDDDGAPIVGVVF